VLVARSMVVGRAIAVGVILGTASLHPRLMVKTSKITMGDRIAFFMGVLRYFSMFHPEVFIVFQLGFEESEFIPHIVKQVGQCCTGLSLWIYTLVSFSVTEKRSWDQRFSSLVIINKPLDAPLHQAYTARWLLPVRSMKNHCTFMDSPLSAS
jgi:hypothetical protein